MGTRNGLLRAATGILLIGAALTVLPGSSTAAPPPKPGYNCTTMASPKPGAVKIMIAGDSITNGSSGDYTWPYRLWRDQVDRGAKVDFVGSFRDTNDIASGRRGSRAYLDCNFDQDKEARGAAKLWTADKGRYSFGTPTPATSDPTNPSYPGATSWIRGATTKYKPSILVLFAGAFDLTFTNGEPIPSKTEGGIANFAVTKLKHVVNQARLGNPGIDVILTTVPPAKSTSRYNLYNTGVRRLAAQMNTKSQRVVVATIPSWANNSWDGLHPNAIGEVAIAAAVDDQLRAVNSKLFARPKKLTRPPLGPRFPAVLKGKAAGGGVQLSWTYPPGADRAVIYARKAGGTWVKKADLVLASLRQFYPKDGTATCKTRCTTYTVRGLSGGAVHEFRIRIGKGHNVSTLYSNLIKVRAPGLLG